jgi:molecular chaperone GrpE (heat shock protein)
MPELEAPRINKWPFLLADALLVALGGFFILTTRWPLTHWEILGVAVCFLSGCWIGLLPFLRDHDAAVKLWEQANLAASAEQLSRVHEVAEQVRLATSQWQSIHEAATKAASTATGAVERVSAEAKAFSEFLGRANDQEKAALKLELDKLRRGGTEHIQVIVHILDHTYALYQAARRSGVPAVVNQLTQFRQACVDAARRVGLLTYEAQPNDLFDPQIHQTPDGKVPAERARIESTVACGYTYQGQPVRRILVALAREEAAVPATAEETAGETAEAVGGTPELPLESAPETERGTA